jgi:demethylmenaquinone methyltransferase/2-methoxy-6-polyprenyl-1,4-benzoquinol methylase
LVAVSTRDQRARSLFAPLGPTYDRAAAVLSFGQDPRWRRFLVSRVRTGAEEVVLDVATGTAAVAVELVRQHGCEVVGLDQSPEMLAVGRRRVHEAGLDGRVRLVEGRAEELPFEEATFDGLTFTYLLRYVDDPGKTLRELARVVRRGKPIAMLEFGVPPGAAARAAWELYVRAGLPALGAMLGRDWWEVGRFLHGSIHDFWRRYPLPSLLALWEAAGIGSVRARPLSFGGGVVVWGTRRG